MSSLPRIYIGIDPGKSGAVATIVDVDGSLAVSTQRLDGTESDVADFVYTASRTRHATLFALLEKVRSSPQMGVKSSFTFGQSYGFLRGLLVAYSIPFEEVTPYRWQQAMSCLTGGDKNITKARAQELFPQVKRIGHAVADALLIAEWCRRSRTEV